MAQVQPKKESEVGQLPTLVDNRPGNTMLEAIRRLLRESKQLDLATGYFEVGALVDLDSHWQTLEGMRVLIGDETSRSTCQAFMKAVKDRESGIEDARAEPDADISAIEA